MHTELTAFGQVARVLSGGKVFRHPERAEDLPVEQLAALRANDGGRNSSDKSTSSSSSATTPAVATHNSNLPRWYQYVSQWIRKDNSIDVKKSDNVIVGWYGQDDPENPQNWSSSYKAFVTGLICIYTFTVYMGSAIYTPSIEGVIMEFGVSYVAANLGLALFVLGYGSGAMIFSPLSEIPALGRNWIYLVTFFLTLCFSVGSALAHNFATLLIMRFLAGFFGSPALATGGATLQDMYSIVKLPYGISVWVAAATMGPAIGPTLGAYAVLGESWRWPLWEQVWLIGPILAVAIFFLPETNPTTILYYRAKRLRSITGDERLRSEGGIEQSALSVRGLVTESFLRPLEIAVVDPGTSFVNFYAAYTYALYYSFFESIPLVYPPIYGFGLGGTSLTFLAVVVTTIIGAIIYVAYQYYYVEPKIRAKGLPELEERLLLAIPASLLMPTGLFIFAWTSRASIHWFVGIIGIGIYSLGFYLLLQCLILYVPLVYPKYGASLLAANDFCRAAMAAGFVLFGRPMFINLGIGGGVSLLAGLAALCIPGILLLYRYGAALRAKSKFAGQGAGDAQVPKEIVLESSNASTNA